MDTLSVDLKSDTYVPEERDAELLRAFVRAIVDAESNAATGKVTFIAPDGEMVELPSGLYDLLRKAAALHSAGNPVTIVPRSNKLSMQDAADILNCRVETVERLTVGGTLPVSRPGDPFPFDVSDVIGYLSQQREITREAMRELRRQAAEEDLYSKTAGLPPQTR